MGNKSLPMTRPPARKSSIMWSGATSHPLQGQTGIITLQEHKHGFALYVIKFHNIEIECVWNSPSFTHWGRVMHICVSKLTIIGSDNGFSPERRQAIIWTNAGLLLIGPLGTNFIEILIEILTFSFKKMRLKVLSAKRRPFCLGLC